jgi:hypothetical protein
MLWRLTRKRGTIRHTGIVDEDVHSSEIGLDPLEGRLNI